MAKLGTNSDGLAAWRCVSYSGSLVIVLDIVYSLLLKRTEPWNVHLPIGSSYDHHITIPAFVVFALSALIVRGKSFDPRLAASFVWSGCFLLFWMRSIYAFPERISFKELSMLSSLVAFLSLSSFLLRSKPVVARSKKGRHAKT